MSKVFNDQHFPFRVIIQTYRKKAVSDYCNAFGFRGNAFSHISINAHQLKDQFGRSDDVFGLFFFLSLKFEIIIKMKLNTLSDQICTIHDTAAL